MKKSDPIPAVVYLRMSSDDQTVSIDRQDQEVNRLVLSGGYRVVRVYRDEGKSGSKDQEKRIDFQRLLLDAPAGEFQAVLVYNASRFARLDTIDGAFAKQILRQHDIYLHTVIEGKIDWNTQQGRMYDFMLSEQNHAYSRSLSKDSISGRLRALEAGHWPHGAVPYGFDRLYTHGDQKTRVSRSDRFRKPRGWTLKLVENQAEASTVRRIYDDFVNRSQSMRQIALTLNAEHVPPPDNLPGAQKLGWTNITVAGILRHKAYVGIAEMGRGKKTTKTAFNRIDPAEKAGVCPVLVDRPLFDAAQQLLDRNRERKARQQSSRCGILSGFLKCHQCGYSLNKEQRGTGPTKYVCKSAARTPSGCPQWLVDESDILPRVTARVVQAIDAEVLKLLDTTPKNDLDQSGILTRHVEALQKRLTTANRRYLESEDDDLAAGLKAELKRLKGELEEAQTALRLAQAVENEGGVTSFVEWWEKQKDAFLVGVIERTEYEGGRTVTTDFLNVPADPDSEVIVNRRRPDPGLGDVVTIELQPVAFDQDGFRALMNRLGVEVTVRWKKAVGPTKKGGNRRWLVDRANIDIDVNWNPASGSSKHVPQSRNGTY